MTSVLYRYSYLINSFVGGLAVFCFVVRREELNFCHFSPVNTKLFTRTIVKLDVGCFLDRSYHNSKSGMEKK